MTLPPLSQLRRFAGALGWDDLNKFTHRIPPSEAVRLGLSNRPVVWYESGSREFAWLQINVRPALSAAVYAPRYSICSGWHAFELPSSIAAVRREAERLEAW
jgi:hypothetical protein